MRSLPGLTIPVPAEGLQHAYYKFYAFLDRSRLKTGWTAERVIAAVNAEGVPCMAGSCCEIYREQAFVGAGLGPKQALPVAQSLSQTSLMFMVHPTLGERDMMDAAAAVGKVMREAAT